jgi:hypothetical protein
MTYRTSDALVTLADLLGAQPSPSDASTTYDEALVGVGVGTVAVADDIWAATAHAPGDPPAIGYHPTEVGAD